MQKIIHQTAMNRIVFGLIFFFCSLIVNGQINFRLVAERIVVDIDSIEKVASNNSNKVEIFIYDKVDTLTNFKTDGLYNTLKIIGSSINFDIYHINYFYFHHPSNSKTCTRNNCLNFKIGSDTLSEFPLTLPGKFIFTYNKDFRQKLKKSDKFHQFHDYKNIFICDKIDDLLELIISKQQHNGDQIDKQLKEISLQLSLQNEKIDSLSKSLSSKPEKFISLNLPMPIGTISLNGSNQINRIYRDIANMNLSIYPFMGIPRLGLGVGLGYTSLSCGLVNQSILDTINKEAFDADGNKYVRVAIGNGIKEKININFVSWTTSLNYKLIKFGEDKKSGFLSVSVGSKISNIISSTYAAQEGSMSWKGYYPQYGISKSMFENQFDFYQNQEVYKGTKKLELNHTFVSLVFSIDCFFKINERVFWNLSLYGDRGSNMLAEGSEKNMLSSNKDNYNSLVYRSDKFKINSNGIKIGISYKF